MFARVLQFNKRWATPIRCVHSSAVVRAQTFNSAASTRDKVMAYVNAVIDLDTLNPLNAARVKPDPPSFNAANEPLRLFSKRNGRVFLCHPNLDVTAMAKVRESWPAERLSDFSRRLFDRSDPVSFDEFRSAFLTPRTESEIATDDQSLMECEAKIAKKCYVHVKLTEHVPCAINIPLVWSRLTHNPRSYQTFVMNPNQPTHSPVSAVSIDSAPYTLHRIYALLPRVWFDSDPALSASDLSRLHYPKLSALDGSARPIDLTPLDLSNCNGKFGMRYVDYLIVSLLREMTLAFRLLAPTKSVTPHPPSLVAHPTHSTPNQPSAAADGGSDGSYTFPVSIGYGVRTLTPYEWFVSRPWANPQLSTADLNRMGSTALRSPLYHALSPCYVVASDGQYINIRDSAFTSYQTVQAVEAQYGAVEAVKFDSIVISGRWTELLPRAAKMQE